MCGFASSAVSSRSFVAAASVRLTTVGWGSIISGELLRREVRVRGRVATAQIVRNATDFGKAPSVPRIVARAGQQLGLHVLYDRRDSLPHTNAHRGKPVAPATQSQLVHQHGHEATAARSEGMPQRD